MPTNGRDSAPTRHVVVIAEDELTRLGLRLLLRTLPVATDVVEVHDDAECERVLRGTPFDAVVADVCRTGRRSAYTLLAGLARLPADLPIIVCTDDVLGVTEYCRANRLGYICLPRGAHSASMLSRALEQILAGPSRPAFEPRGSASFPALDPIISLTPKEREVLTLVADGGSSKEIAAALRVSLRTVESHRARICSKLGVKSVAGLTKVAIRAGLASVGEGLAGAAPNSAAPA